MKISEETSMVGKIGGTAINLINLTIVSRIIFFTGPIPLHCQRQRSHIFDFFVLWIPFVIPLHRNLNIVHCLLIHYKYHK